MRKVRDKSTISLSALTTYEMHGSPQRRGKRCSFDTPFGTGSAENFLREAVREAVIKRALTFFFLYIERAMLKSISSDSVHLAVN